VKDKIRALSIRYTLLPPSSLYIRYFDFQLVIPVREVQPVKRHKNQDRSHNKVSDTLGIGHEIVESEEFHGVLLLMMFFIVRMFI
jgi:hypothetical protein